MDKSEKPARKSPAGAHKPEATGNVKVTRPMNGNEYLELLRDDRTIYIYGERVKDVTEHPAFRNTSRMIARCYDALHDPKTKDKLTMPDGDGQRQLHARLFPRAEDPR